METRFGMSYLSLAVFVAIFFVAWGLGHNLIALGAFVGTLLSFFFFFWYLWKV